MDHNKIREVVLVYKEWFDAMEIEPQRINSEKSFGNCRRQELLKHACYLAHNILSFLNEDKIGKANRHLGSMQTIMSFAGVYKLSELMEQNRPT